MRWYVLINPEWYDPREDVGYSWSGEADNEGDAFAKACAQCDVDNEHFHDKDCASEHVGDPDYEQDVDGAGDPWACDCGVTLTTTETAQLWEAHPDWQSLVQEVYRTFGPKADQVADAHVNPLWLQVRGALAVAHAL